MWICRTCLQETNMDSNVVKLNTNNVESSMIRSKLSDCIPGIFIDLLEEPIMCTPCITSLNVAFNFKHQCLKSEAALIKLLHVRDKLTGTFVQNSNIKLEVEHVPENITENVATDNHISLNNDSNINKHEIENCEYKSIYLPVVTEKSLSTDTLLTKTDEPQIFEDHMEEEEAPKACEMADNDSKSKITDLQDDINVVKHEIEDFKYKPFDLHGDGVMVHKTNCEEMLQAETNKLEIFEVRAETEVDDLHGTINTEVTLSVSNHTKEENPEDDNATNRNNKSAKSSMRCNKCEYSTNVKRNFVLHMKSHTVEKSLKCVMCNYKCINKSSLQNHIQTHTGVKPFECVVCNNVYSNKHNLNYHMKSHAEENPFKCEVCTYRCINKANLQQHVKTHTGEKPFKCEMCDYRCIQKTNLQQHMKTHT